MIKYEIWIPFKSVGASVEQEQEVNVQIKKNTSTPVTFVAENDLFIINIIC